MTTNRFFLGAMSPPFARRFDEACKAAGIDAWTEIAMGSRHGYTTAEGYHAAKAMLASMLRARR